MKTVIVQSQQKWEAVAISRKTETMLVQEMNELGEQGWEMVSTVYYKDAKGAMTWTAFLKRPKFGQPAKAPSPAASAESQGQGPGKPEEEAAQPDGFDLSGEIFDVKK